MAFSFSPKIVTNGLVLYLDAANRNSYVSGSTTWNDISRSGNNGTLTNGPTFNSANGGSIVFDGIDDNVTLPHVFNISSGGLTFNTWFNCSNTSWSPLLSDWYTNQWSFNLQVYLGNVSFSIRNNNNDNLPGLISSYSILANTIYNICCTYDPITKITNLYANGTLYSVTSNSNANPYVRNTSNNFNIGLKQDSSNYLSGRVYNTQIYNRALSATEVRQNYNALKGRYGI